MTGDVHAVRRAAVAALLAEEGAEALLVTDLLNITYLTGFRGSAGCLLLESDGQAALATDSRYELQVADQAPGVVHVITRAYTAGALSARRGPAGGRVAVEAESLRLSEIPAVERELAAAGLPGAPVQTRGLVERARRLKDHVELEAITRSCAVADGAWERICATGALAAGRREIDVAADLEYAMRVAGSERVAFDTIVASGPNGALPHHDAGDRELRHGDLVVVDFGAVVDGYASDCSRTVAIGEVPDQLREAYELVLRAQLAGVQAVRPGIGCAELDAVARDIISAAGRGPDFGHSLGHGVGLDVHEAPAISSRATGTLADGDVVTVEPGVYLAGRGGIRIEDTVAVTGSGHRVLTVTGKEFRRF